MEPLLVLDLYDFLLRTYSNRIYLLPILMKHFLLRSIFFLAVLGACTAGLVFCIYRQDNNNYLMAYTLKLNRLRTTESPRLILVGGSNVAFGVDSKMLADSLKMNPINFGLHAALSLRYVMRDVIKYSRPNDLIILLPEYESFYNKGGGEGSAFSQLLYYNHMHGWMEMSFYEWVNALHGFLYTPIDYLRGFIRNAPPRIYTYSCSAFNPYGDEVAHRYHASGRCTPNAAYDVPSDVFPINDGEEIWFIESYNKLIERKATVYIFPPAMVEAGVAYRKGKIRAVNAFFERHGLSYASSIEQSIFPDSTFFDTQYHLNDAGVQMNTRRLIREIRRLQEKPQQQQSVKASE